MTLTATRTDKLHVATTPAVSSRHTRSVYQSSVYLVMQKGLNAARCLEKHADDRHHGQSAIRQLGGPWLELNMISKIVPTNLHITPVWLKPLHAKCSL